MAIQRLGAYMAALAMTTALTAPTFAHEERRYPFNSSRQVSMFIGFSSEPAFEDSYNGVDVILSSFNGFCPGGEPTQDAIEAPISTRGTASLPDKDTVDLQVDAIYLSTAVKPGGPLGWLPPPGILARTTLTTTRPLREAFGEPGVYNTQFRPTHPGNPTVGGAYGFYILGTVHAGPKTATCPENLGGRTYQLAPRTVSIRGYFVCTKGVLRGQFNCVESIPSFPGSPQDGYAPNSHL